MDFAKNEITEVKNAAAASEANQVAELNELQLTLVGGGNVTVIIG